MNYEDKSAVVSFDGKYRYMLTREWAREDNEGTFEAEGSCVFIMLNPSTADADIDDPTIRKCVGFARSWGFRKLVVVNLFAFRATSPADLMTADYPVGMENAHWIRHALAEAGGVVCAWGIHGRYRGQDHAVVALLDAEAIQPLTLGLTKAGYPKHPLYPAYGTKLRSFNPL